MFVMREVFIKALKAHRPGCRSPSDLVFSSGIPRASRLKVDAKGPPPAPSKKWIDGFVNKCIIGQKNFHPSIQQSNNPIIFVCHVTPGFP
jgi:hypothetical protein